MSVPHMKFCSVKLDRQHENVFFTISAFTSTKQAITSSFVFYPLMFHFTYPVKDEVHKDMFAVIVMLTLSRKCLLPYDHLNWSKPGTFVQFPLV